MEAIQILKRYQQNPRTDSEWEQQLNDLQVLLENCVFIQERWCSLEPLLTSPDVLSFAPEESRKFSAIDKVPTVSVINQTGDMITNWLIMSVIIYYLFKLDSLWNKTCVNGIWNGLKPTGLDVQVMMELMGQNSSWFKYKTHQIYCNLKY